MHTFKTPLPSAKNKRFHEPHLIIAEHFLEPGGEWDIQLPGWSLIQVKSGTGYWLQPRTNWELTTGTTILRSDSAQGIIRASQLGGMALNYFWVQPELLGGLATVGEQLLLAEMASKTEFSLKMLPPEDPVAITLKNLFASHNGSTILLRARLLQVFLEVSGHGFENLTVEIVAPVEAKQRLRMLLKNTPASSLMNLSFSDLAKTMNCTKRHLSRVFQEVVGMSFREKQTSIRMARAREILETTDQKIVDVALESGYESLSLFNLMFRRRFGMSPGKWRLNRRGEGGNTARPAREAASTARDMTASASTEGWPARAGHRQ